MPNENKNIEDVIKEFHKNNKDNYRASPGREAASPSLEKLIKDFKGLKSKKYSPSKLMDKFDYLLEGYNLGEKADETKKDLLASIADYVAEEGKLGGKEELEQAIYKEAEALANAQFDALKYAQQGTKELDDFDTVLFGGLDKIAKAQGESKIKIENQKELENVTNAFYMCAGLENKEKDKMHATFVNFVEDVKQVDKKTNLEKLEILAKAEKRENQRTVITPKKEEKKKKNFKIKNPLKKSSRSKVKKKEKEEVSQKESKKEEVNLVDKPPQERTFTAAKRPAIKQNQQFNIGTRETVTPMPPKSEPNKPEIISIPPKPQKAETLEQQLKSSELSREQSMDQVIKETRESVKKASEAIKRETANLVDKEREQKAQQVDKVQENTNLESDVRYEDFPKLKEEINTRLHEQRDKDLKKEKEEVISMPPKSDKVQEQEAKPDEVNTKSEPKNTITEEERKAREKLQKEYAKFEQEKFVNSPVDSENDYKELQDMVEGKKETAREFKKKKEAKKTEESLDKFHKKNPFLQNPEQADKELDLKKALNDFGKATLNPQKNQPDSISAGMNFDEGNGAFKKIMKIMDKEPLKVSELVGKIENMVDSYAKKGTNIDSKKHKDAILNAVGGVLEVRGNKIFSETKTFEEQKFQLAEKLVNDVVSDLQKQEKSGKTLNESQKTLINKDSSPLKDLMKNDGGKIKINKKSELQNIVNSLNKLNEKEQLSAGNLDKNQHSIKAISMLSANTETKDPQNQLDKINVSSKSPNKKPMQLTAPKENPSPADKLRFEAGLEEQRLTKRGRIKEKVKSFVKSAQETARKTPIIGNSKGVMSSTKQAEQNRGKAK